MGLDERIEKLEALAADLKSERDETTIAVDVGGY